MFHYQQYTLATDKSKKNRLYDSEHDSTMKYHELLTQWQNITFQKTCTVISHQFIWNSTIIWHITRHVMH